MDIDIAYLALLWTCWISRCMATPLAQHLLNQQVCDNHACHTHAESVVVWQPSWHNTRWMSRCMPTITCKSQEGTCWTRPLPLSPIIIYKGLQHYFVKLFTKRFTKFPPPTHPMWGGGIFLKKIKQDDYQCMYVCRADDVCAYAESMCMYVCMYACMDGWMDAESMCMYAHHMTYVCM